MLESMVHYVEDNGANAGINSADSGVNGVDAGINSEDGRINRVYCRINAVNGRIIGEDTGNSAAEGFRINAEDADKK